MLRKQYLLSSAIDTEAESGRGKRVNLIAAAAVLLALMRNKPTWHCLKKTTRVRTLCYKKPKLVYLQARTKHCAKANFPRHHHRSYRLKFVHSLSAAASVFLPPSPAEGVRIERLNNERWFVRPNLRYELTPTTVRRNREGRRRDRP